jgi:antitoxin (DNA-binding transcriptional repressor) of toxin-antitoxin stability system
MYNIRMATLTVSQARAALPELLTRVEAGEEVTITRHGRPVAVLVRPDVLRSRAEVIIEDAGRLHQLLTSAVHTDLPSASGITLERAEELIRDIRTGRDRR